MIRQIRSLAALAALAAGAASPADAADPATPKGSINSKLPTVDELIESLPTGDLGKKKAPTLAAEIPGVPTSAEAPAADGPPAGETAPPAAAEKSLFDCLQCDGSEYKSLFDSIHTPSGKAKHWYEKLNVRGYTQFRWGRTVASEHDSAAPYLLGDRAINGNAENFSIRRARFILFGDVSDHLYLYAQPDFASTPPDSSRNTFFGQLRDLYADVHLDKEKVHRLRVGLSKVPYGFENMQSSQNRVALDRTDALNTAVAPNERDLGVFYYYTPEDKQKLFKDLVDGGLKGSGNYGIFGVGVYNGQGGSQFEQNRLTHVVARATYPVQLPNGQVVEGSLQGYTGRVQVSGDDIAALGGPDVDTPDGTGDRPGFRDSRVAATFVWYPQPFGFQAEWNAGKGPGLNDAQTAVETRSLHGGYLMSMYRHDTPDHGIFTPYVRWQYFEGGYRSVANAPYGIHRQTDIGLEWQIRKEMELVFEYSRVNGANLSADDDAGDVSYRNFNGHVFRVQFQINY